MKHTNVVSGGMWGKGKNKKGTADAVREVLQSPFPHLFILRDLRCLRVLTSFPGYILLRENFSVNDDIYRLYIKH